MDYWSLLKCVSWDYDIKVATEKELCLKRHSVAAHAFNLMDSGLSKAILWTLVYRRSTIKVQLVSVFILIICLTKGFSKCSILFDWFSQTVASCIIVLIDSIKIPGHVVLGMRLAAVWTVYVNPSSASLWVVRIWLFQFQHSEFTDTCDAGLNSVELTPIALNRVKSNPC